METKIYLSVRSQGRKLSLFDSPSNLFFPQHNSRSYLCSFFFNPLQTQPRFRSLSIPLSQREFPRELRGKATFVPSFRQPRNSLEIIETNPFRVETFLALKSTSGNQLINTAQQEQRIFWILGVGNLKYPKQVNKSCNSVISYIFQILTLLQNWQLKKIQF